MKVLNLIGCCQEQKNNITEFINDNNIQYGVIADNVDLLELSENDASIIDCEPKFENYDHVITNYTYDVEFNDDTCTDSKGWHASFGYCQDYINTYNGTNESYFDDYKGGTASIRCNETEEVVFETEVKQQY